MFCTLFRFLWFDNSIKVQIVVYFFTQITCLRVNAWFPLIKSLTRSAYHSTFLNMWLFQIDVIMLMYYLIDLPYRSVKRSYWLLWIPTNMISWCINLRTQKKYICYTYCRVWCKLDMYGTFFILWNLEL